MSAALDRVLDLAVTLAATNGAKSDTTEPLSFIYDAVMAADIRDVRDLLSEFVDLLDQGDPRALSLEAAVAGPEEAGMTIEDGRRMAATWAANHPAMWTDERYTVICQLLYGVLDEELAEFLDGGEGS